MREKRYDIPVKKQIRIFIDTDAACEADDHFAIAHALMTSKAKVTGIAAEHFRQHGSMEQSLSEIRKICGFFGFDEKLVFAGEEGPFEEKAKGMEFGASEASAALIREAMSDDKRPLFVICQGALTNIAAAILREPVICNHMLLMVIGGTNYPEGGYEFNTMNDPEAFNIVMKSTAPVWMFPEEVYATMQMPLSEMFQKVYPYGELGKYLTERTIRMVEEMTGKVPDYSEQAPYDYAIGFPNGESWSLGDSCAIGTLISHHSGEWKTVKAPIVNSDGSYRIPDDGKTIRWYERINMRLILEDFFSKLQYEFG